MTSNKYVYFIPQGGLNDCFGTINNVLYYCKIKNRKLIIDFKNSQYKINLSEYFHFENENIIYDYNFIEKEFHNNKFSVFNNLDICDIINCFQKDYTNHNKPTSKLKYLPNKPYFSYNDIDLLLPDKDINEDIIIHTRTGGGGNYFPWMYQGFYFFRDHIILKNNFKDLIKEKIKLLNDNYLAIHIRNTDIKCDYKMIYVDNKNIIDSFKQIYLCTDNEVVLNYYKKLNLNILNFTTFPDKNLYGNYENQSLHSCKNIDNNTRFIDLFVDIFIATKSEILLTSKNYNGKLGNFTLFLKQCHENKSCILSKIE
jgi:hypothetical protein